jgi:hypothetical protein
LRATTKHLTTAAIAGKCLQQPAAIAGKCLQQPAAIAGKCLQQPAVAGRAEHPVGDRAQPGTVCLEPFSEEVAFVHKSLLSSSPDKEVTGQTAQM